MDDPRPQEETSGPHFLVRSLHAPEHHVLVGEARIHPVIYVFHLEEHQERTDGIPDRAHTDRRPRVFPPEFLAEHAGHSSRIPAAGRPSRVYGETRASSDTEFELWNLWAGVRARRKPPA